MKYDIGTIRHDQYGAAVSVYFEDDSYMELDVEMRWDGSSDEMLIESVNADYYDEEENVLEMSNEELEALAVEIFDKNNTFDKVLREMERAYIDEHEG